MPKEIKKVLYRFINKIWKEGRFPEDWKRGVICSTFKNGKKNEKKNGSMEEELLWIRSTFIHPKWERKEKQKQKVEEKLKEG